MSASNDATVLPPGYRWYALAVLTAVYACHALDRWILSAVIEPIKAEFGLSDRAMGFLAGLAYTIALAIAIIPVGYLIDRVKRRNLLATILAVWSAVTALSGFVQSYYQLLVARMATGMAEAGGSPTSLSLISDYFSPQQRSTAVGLFYVGSAIGIATGLAAGGYIAATYGWRYAFFVAGMPGLVLSLVVWLTLREPQRGAHDETQLTEVPVPGGLRAALRTLVGNPVLLSVFIGILISSATSATVNTWMGATLMREHGLDLRAAGIAAAIGAGAFQSVGVALAGTVADRLALRSRWGLMLLPAVVSVLSVPLTLGFIFSSETVVAVAFLCALGLTLTAWLGPAFAFAMNVTPASQRGIVLSGLQMGANLVGSGLGPLLTGTLSDAIGGDHGLGKALALTVLLNLVGCYFYLRAARLHSSTVARRVRT